MSGQVYELILEEMEAGELTRIERKVFDALRTHPAGLRREQLVAIVYGQSVRAGGLKNNSTFDRKVRLAIASLRARLVPILSSSGQAGYRMDTSEESRRKMVRELLSRRAHLDELIARATKFYGLPAEMPAREVAAQEALL
jgi:hypothetical protein